MPRDLDEVLHDWPFEPEPGEISVREVRARDGRTVLQIRIELGVLQLEVTDRPDRARPHGFPTYLEYLRYRARTARRGRGRDRDPDERWTMSREHCEQADREFIQFYHRRVAWLTLQRFDRAVADADHTLALMDFVVMHCDDSDYVMAHERLRSLVLFHKTQALAASGLDRRKPEEAIDAIRDGIDWLKKHQAKMAEEAPAVRDAEASGDEDESESSGPEIGPLIEQLRAIEREIRSNFPIEKTLKEQLEEAVEREDYERAARLRDLIRAKAAGKRA